MGTEVAADILGDEWKGYVVRITGGNDKQGFPMKQGVLQPSRVRLLLSDGHSCYRVRRSGERKRKSVRGCIVSSDLSVLALAIVKQGEEDIPGLTDVVHPKRLGPKRARKIQKFFGLSKEDDVRKYVIRREVQPKGEGKKAYTKAPKIQRLITPQRLQHKRHLIALKRRQQEKVKDEAVSFRSSFSQVFSSSSLPLCPFSPFSFLLQPLTLPERVRPDPGQACARGKGPEGRPAQAARKLSQVESQKKCFRRFFSILSTFSNSSTWGREGGGAKYGKSHGVFVIFLSQCLQ